MRKNEEQRKVESDQTDDDGEDDAAVESDVTTSVNDTNN